MYMFGGVWTDGLKVVPGRHVLEDASRRVFGAPHARPIASIIYEYICSDAWFCSGLHTAIRETRESRQ